MHITMYIGNSKKLSNNKDVCPLEDNNIPIEEDRAGIQVSKSRNLVFWFCS